MKPEEAIKTLTEGLPADNWKLEPVLKDAIKLGIEALKRVKAYKEAHVGLHYEPMPGETEE